MKYILSFSIECGKKTCASSPGKFCQYFGHDLRGNGLCHFFGTLEDKDGWVQRRDECLSMTRREL